MSQSLLLSSQPSRRWLSVRDPRLRVICALLFAVAVVGLQQPGSAAIAFSAATLISIAAGNPMRPLLRRLWLLEGFMLVLFLFLPFTIPGEPLFELGSLSASADGVWRAALIFLKAHAIIIVLHTLAGSMEPVVLGHALGHLRLPQKLVHLLLFTVRYISLLHEEYQRLRLAMRARAFVPRSNAHTWRSAGWLLGMLLVRSFERAQRIQQAMKCRGFQGRFYLLDHPRWQPADSLLLIAWSVALCLMVTGDKIL